MREHDLPRSAGGPGKGNIPGKGNKVARMVGDSKMESARG